MRAVTLSTASGAQAGLTGRITLLGAELDHTGAATCLLYLTSASGQVIARMRASAALPDVRWWGPDGFDTDSDFYYNLSAGTLTLWLK